MTRTAASVRASSRRRITPTALGFSRHVAYELPGKALPGLGGSWARLDVTIFVQVGFVVLVGLACKNGILIVGFARDRQQEGASRFDSAVEAAKVGRVRSS
jgi:Cu/Ag efflux pump CusA